MPDVTPTVTQIQAIYGSIILANILTCWLFGAVLVLVSVDLIISMQSLADEETYIYWQGSRQDTPWLRILVLALMSMSTIGSAACCSRSWKAIIVNFGDPLRYFRATHAEDRIIPLTNNITAVATEAFMAFKTLRFAKAMRWAGGSRGRVALCVISGIFLIGWIANAGLALGVPLWAITHPSLGDVTMSDGLTWKPYVKFWLNIQVGCFVAVDALLSISLASELLTARSGSDASNAAINSIVGVLARQGFVILLCRIAQLLVINKVSGPWSNYFFSFIGQVYNITVLSLLLRPRATGRRAEVHSVQHDPSSSQAAPVMPTDPDLSMVKLRNQEMTQVWSIPTSPRQGAYVLPMASVDEG